MAILLSILLIILTCVVIWRASDGFEAASEYLGRNLSDGVRGATINAIGSSMPELFTTIFFLFILKDSNGFAGGIGTTAGSAVFNGVIIPSLVILVVIYYGIANGARVSKKVVLRDGISLLIAEAVLILFIGGSTLDWWQGVILMGMYGAYMTYMLTTMGSGGGESEGGGDDDDDDDDEGDEKNVVLSLITLDLEPVFIRGEIKNSNAWPLLLAATAVIGGACFFLVEACTTLGLELGIPIYFVAVVLASAATSVPDTIISMRDAMKGNYDDAVSNAIGSNIFDICFALGFPLFLYTLIYGPITMCQEVVEDVAELRILLFVMTAVAVIIFYLGRTMKTPHAIALLGIYVLFVLYIIGDPQIAGYSEPLSEQLHAIDGVFDNFRFWTDTSIVAPPCGIGGMGGH